MTSSGRHLTATTPTPARHNRDHAFRTPRDQLCGRADLARLQCNALPFQAAEIDRRVDVELGQEFMGDLRPAFDHLSVVPLQPVPPTAHMVSMAPAWALACRPRPCPNAH